MYVNLPERQRFWQKKIRVESICAHGFNQALGFKISLCFYLFWEEPRSAKVLVEVDEGPHFALETKWTDPREWSRDHLRGSAVSSYLLKSAVWKSKFECKSDEHNEREKLSENWIWIDKEYLNGSLVSFRALLSSKWIIITWGFHY